MEARGVKFLTSTRATGFVTRAQRRSEAAAHGVTADTPAVEASPTTSRAAGGGGGDAEIAAVQCEGGGGRALLEADEVVFAVGATALASMVRSSPELSAHAEWRKYARLRGTGVLATRLFLDRNVPTPYTANACWGFDEGVGMTCDRRASPVEASVSTAPAVSTAPNVSCARDPLTDVVAGGSTLAGCTRSPTRLAA